MDNSLLDIIKQLNDNRSKLSALFSLYNSSLLAAETNRQAIGGYYEQMIDIKNDLNVMNNQLANMKKTERVNAISQNKTKIKKLDIQVVDLKNTFKGCCAEYRVALKDCGSLKSEYKHTISELCKEFKAQATDKTDPYIIKGYKQQVKIIKAILDRIEQLISDYNVKKNKVEEDDTKFNILFESVNAMIDRMKNIA